MRLITALVASGGVIGVLPIVYEQIQNVPCPKIGSVPACYVVLVAYVLILAATFMGKHWRAYVFVPAWLVVFSIAALATGLELFIPNTCPTSKLGIPSCFLSLAMTLMLVTAYVVERKFDRDFKTAGDP